MALEEFCAKQTSEMMQLNRLVNFFLFYLQPSHCFLCTLLLMNASLVFVGAKYKHERECNAIIAQTKRR